MKKSLVLIDISNLYMCAKHKYSGRVDLEKMISELVKNPNEEILNIIAYGFYEDDKANSFISKLKFLGIEPKFKEVKVFVSQDSVSKKGDSDVQITVDAISYLPRYDVLYLVSADGDFIPLVQFLQSRAVAVNTIGININKELKALSNNFVEITENLIFRNGTQNETPEVQLS